jgi:hypothetical protein
MLRIASSLVIFTALLLTGCNGGDDEAGNGGGNSGDSQAGDDGVTNLSTVSLPDDFPDDVPTYPDATLAVAAEMPTGFTVVHNSADAVDDVSAFFKTELEEEGWEVGQTIDTPQGSMIVATKDDRQVGVTIGAEDDQTTISTTITSQM